jgi:2-polyprenyl-6-hydroxyphenyl methylase/3-demethylubiquinone-9 3-methyltransferase
VVKTVFNLVLKTTWEVLVKALQIAGLAKKENDAVPKLNTQLRRHLDIVSVIRQIGITPNEILDVGCGTGLLAQALVEHGYSNVTGVDWLPKEKVEYLKYLNSYYQVNLNEASEMPLPSKKYDLVICSDVLEHLENPASVIRQMAKFVNPEGVILITVPNAVNIFQRWRFLLTGNSTRYKTEKPNGWGHITFFTTNIMKSLAQRGGLKVKKIYGGGCYHDGMWFLPQKSWSSFWSYNLNYVLKLSPSQ